MLQYTKEEMPHKRAFQEDKCFKPYQKVYKGFLYTQENYLNRIENVYGNI